MPRLDTTLALKNAGFRQGLDEAKNQAREFRKFLTSTFAAALAVGGITAGLRSIADHMGEIKDRSEILDLTAESTQRLEHAFKQGAASSEDFQKGFVKFLDTMGSARDGNEEAIASFEKVGVTWEDLQKKSPEELLYKVADGLAKIQDHTDRLAAAKDLFGKPAAKLLPTLQEGSEAMGQLAADADAASDRTVESWDKAAKKIETIWDRLRNNIGAMIVDVAEKSDRSMKDLPGNLKNFIPSSWLNKTMPDLPANRGVGEGDMKYEVPGSGQPENSTGDSKVDPRIAKEIKENADEYLKTVFQGLKTEQEMGDNRSENDAKHNEAAREIAEIERQTTDDNAKAENDRLAKTSRRLALSQEEGRIGAQIAAIEKRRDESGDDKEKAQANREIAALQQQIKGIGVERDELEKAIARTQFEASQQAESAEIERLRAINPQLAAKREIAMLERQIAENVKEAKTSDELRTAELAKQNGELRSQIANVRERELDRQATERRKPADQRLTERRDRQAQAREKREIEGGERERERNAEKNKIDRPDIFKKKGDPAEDLFKGKDPRKRDDKNPDPMAQPKKAPDAPGNPQPNKPTDVPQEKPKDDFGADVKAKLDTINQTLQEIKEKLPEPFAEEG